MKIFWSWQSDTPGKTGRHLVRDALDAAIEELRQSREIEEPETRDLREALHVDQDRQDVAGSPDLVRTILEKIDRCAVFVADVTSVSTIAGRPDENPPVAEKRNMNPNVAIELGYAMKARGDNFLMVMNTYYGGRGFVPFDLTHKAGPIMYSLAPDADRPTRDAAMADLQRQLRVALRPYVQEAAAPPPAAFPETPTTFTKAVYFQHQDVLARIGEERDGDRIEYVYQDGNAFYLRVIPHVVPERPILQNDLHWLAKNHCPFSLWKRASQLADTNDYGAIVIEPISTASGWIKASTQFFQNGEIWGIAPWLLRPDDGSKRIGQGAFETTYRMILGRYTQVMADRLRIPLPYTVEAGAVGLKGYRVAVGNQPDDSYGPIRDPEFSIRLVLNDISSANLDRAVNRISEELFRLTGYPRP